MPSLTRVLLAVALVSALWWLAGPALRSLPAQDLAEPSNLAQGSTSQGGLIESPDPAVRTWLHQKSKESDNYLGVMLSESDSILRRWDGDRRRPVRVYIVPSTMVGHTANHDRAVRNAFNRWRRVGDISVSFDLVLDSSFADVRVEWIHAFEGNRAGQARIRWRSDGWIQSGTLTLATHNQRGHPYNLDGVFTVALHEIGHLLGLGHSDDPEDVMAPTTTVHDLTLRDRRTATVLYSVPPGSWK